jgi:hypothetical protein
MKIENEMKTIRGMKTAELLRMILSLIDQPAGLAEELARHGHVTTAAAQWSSRRARASPPRSAG